MNHRHRQEFEKIKREPTKQELDGRFKLACVIALRGIRVHKVRITHSVNAEVGIGNTQPQGSASETSIIASYG